MSEEKKLEEIPAPAQDLTDEEAASAKGGSNTYAGVTTITAGTLNYSGPTNVNGGTRK